MGFFTIFSKNNTAVQGRSKDDKAKESIQEDISTGLGSGAISEKSKKSSSASSQKGKSSKSRSKVRSVQVPAKSNNVKAAEAFVHQFNNYSSEEDMLALFEDRETSRFVLEDGFAMPMNQWARTTSQCKASFPDMKFTYKTLKEASPTQVLIDDVRFSGTHTGAPFTFAPQFPPIPTSNKFVQNDEERFVFDMTQDGKIRHLHVIALGCYTGPPGVYEQLGGSLAPPTKNASCNQRWFKFLRAALQYKIGLNFKFTKSVVFC